MAWSEMDATFRAVAEEVCTEKELEALKVMAGGYGSRRAALVLGIDRKSYRDRIKRAERRILDEYDKRGLSL